MLIWRAEEGCCDNCARLHGKRNGDGWTSDTFDQVTFNIPGLPPRHEHCRCEAIDEADFVATLGRYVMPPRRTPHKPATSNTPRPTRPLKLPELTPGQKLWRRIFGGTHR